MIEFEYRKIEFWVIPIFIIICLFNEMFDKVVTVVFVLLFALKFNNNHFTHQVKITDIKNIDKDNFRKYRLK